jgi:hypothetical protein
VKTIGFDGRAAREDLNLVEASPRLAKLIDYIFSKPECLVTSCFVKEQMRKGRIQGVSTRDKRFVQLSVRMRITCFSATIAEFAVTSAPVIHDKTV